MLMTRREPTFMSRFETPGFRTLREEMDRLFDAWATDLAPIDHEAPFRPQVNVVENDKFLEVTAELPGLDEKDVEVELMNDCVILRGQKTQEAFDAGDNWYRRERLFGSFERIVPLPWKIDDQKAKADAMFKNGVLKVTVERPKEVTHKAKKLTVKAA